MVDLSAHLDSATNVIWNRYVQFHEQGRRPEALDALAGFVATVSAYPAQHRYALVDALCRQTVDVGRTGLLRQPLLTGLVLPQLRIGREMRQPKYAKRIAKLSDGILGLPKGFELLGLKDLRVDELLIEAMELDRNDVESRDLLIEYYKRALEYDTHELPTGILAPPDKFREMLDRFEQLLITSGRAMEFSEQLTEWRFHSEAWQDYLSRRNEFIDYPDYLAKAGRLDLL